MVGSGALYGRCVVVLVVNPMVLIMSDSVNANEEAADAAESVADTEMLNCLLDSKCNGIHSRGVIA